MFGSKRSQSWSWNGRRAFASLVAVFLCLGASSTATDKKLNEARHAIDSEISWTRLEVEATLAARALEREKSSWDYSQSLARQAARQSLMRLSVYHQSMHERRAVVQKRIAALDRLARGGMARLLFGGARPPQAIWWTLLGTPQTKKLDTKVGVVDVRVLWWLTRLVAWDLREVSAFTRVHHDTRAALLQSTRELEGLGSSRWIRALEVAATEEFANAVHEERVRVQDERVGALARSPAFARELNNELSRLETSRSELRRALRDSGYAITRRSLVRPVSGPIVGRYGTHKDHATGIDSFRHGIEIAARPGAKIAVCAAGKVVAIDRIDLYENVVVVDHGEHYYSMLGRLERVDVAVGQNLEAGEIVGTLARKRMDDGLRDTVYFEVRHGDLTLDPARFLEAFSTSIESLDSLSTNRPASGKSRGRKAHAKK
jgi:murein DD-endopeptidase MepM/ murein hydrolase activator NlpD